jgi:ubiquinone biosynthesis protein
MFNLKQQYLNIKRAKEILTVFARYGLSYLFDLPAVEKSLNLGRKFFVKKEQEDKIKRLTWPQRTRLAFEALGPTFIKLGQVLSTRADLIPKEFVEELSLLQDEVPAFPYAQVEEIILSELGQPISEIFLEFDEKPTAAASLSQVHKAKTKGGAIVAVKIQRPNIRQSIETDLIIISDLAKFIAKRSINGHLYQPVEIVDEFSKYIKMELDFIGEGRNLDRFNENFKDSAEVSFPKVYWAMTTSKVLTMEFIEGVKISIAAKSENQVYDKKLIAERVAEAVLKQIFNDGFFHGDPHPGNIFIKPDNKITFLDCGLVGRLDRETKELIADQFIGILNNDTEKIIASWQEMEIIGPDADLKMIKSKIAGFFDKYLNLPLKNLKMGEILMEFLEIMVCCQVKVPTNLVLLSKAMVTLESIGRELNGDFNLAEHVQPFAKKLIAKKFEPKELFNRAQIDFKNFINLLENFPGDWRWLARTLRRGELNIGIKHKNLEKLVLVIDHASNRLSFSLIIAALIIGSSFIMQTSRGPFVLGYPALGVAGYLTAGILGVGLIISIIRSGKF